MWDSFATEGGLIFDDLVPCLDRGVHYGTQCALKQAAKGGVKIIGISIFTYESGWIRRGGLQRSFISKLTGLSTEKLKDIVATGKDIYIDTKNEYKYLETQCTTPPAAGADGWTVKFLTRDILKKIQNGQINIENEKVIYVFYNIEGVQSLGIPSAENELGLSEHMEQTILNRVNELRTFDYWPQYVTICHHFGNHVAGHARTVPHKLHGLGLKQDEYLNDGITAAGYKIIKELLSTEKEFRINVDIKHFSAQSRIDYYKLLDDEYSFMEGGKRKYKVPIICSHTGIASSPQTLVEMKMHAVNEYTATNTYLHNWSVNLCREDLEKIQDSDGLIGLQIDLKRLTGDKYLNTIIKDQKAIRKETNPVVKKEMEAKLAKLSCETVWANLFTAMALLNVNRPNNKAAWDLFCIGSDYDGIVSYLPGYTTMDSYSTLKEDMKKSLDKAEYMFMGNIDINGKKLDKAFIQSLMFGYTSDQLLDKIFSDNAITFMAKNFVDKFVP